ncbi:MAG: hypothetical protein HXS50_04820, partial [Theionarchaea archaeon]|nr:hypothetical protein [Theionarchaea archaeon]
MGVSVVDTTLYNGIGIPAEWPPDYGISAETESDVMPVPYLEEIPDVIPIDVGRQLFVDDFLIEHTTLARTYHHAEYHPASPVLEPDRIWETESECKGYPSPVAMVFSDGVWGSWTGTAFPRATTTDGRGRR